MPAILQGIRGLGGTVIKTNVDLERAKLIQSTLAAMASEMFRPDGQKTDTTGGQPQWTTTKHEIGPASGNGAMARGEDRP
jgi:hypothetical protein